MNAPYFQIKIQDEQKEYAREIVEYSIKNHPVTDIFANDPNGKARQFEFRYTGSLGEVVFADTYGLPRPKRSFGAIDGQDFGQDFLLIINNKMHSVDVKTMHRKGNVFLENYVLNIPGYQMHKDFSVTDYYFCISLHDVGHSSYATFLGLINKSDVIDGKIGNLFKSGTMRIRQDGTSFKFYRDTYEIMFRHITPPIITDEIRKMEGFKELYLLPGRKDNLY